MKAAMALAQNRLLRTALVQIINDPDRAVQFALRAIDDCKRLEAQGLRDDLKKSVKRKIT